jgi:hypothetical protein
MERLVSRVWPAGWALILVGFFVLVGGSAAWAADYLQAQVATEAPSLLALMAALGFGMGLSLLGVSLLALSADQKRALKGIPDAVEYPL